MEIVPRETCQNIDLIMDIKSLWFKDLFSALPDAWIWSVFIKNFKEQWIKGRINNPDQTFKILEKMPLVQKTTSISFTNGPDAIVEAGAMIVDDHVAVMPGVHIQGGAYVAGHSILGPGTQVRHGAFIRGGVISGENCVIGHTTEVKSSIFANNAKAGHFSYVGDSILGNDVNLGAGTKLSNLKIVAGNINLNIDGERIDSGLRKFGAVLGDDCQTGCNSVLNPGVVLAKKCLVYPNVSVRTGFYSEKTRIK